MYIFFHKLKELFFEEQARWFLWTPVLFALGIGLYFSCNNEPNYWFSLIMFETILIIAVIFRRYLLILSGLLIVTIVLLGFIDIQLRTVYLDGQRGNIEEEVNYFQGRVLEKGYNYRGNERLVLDNVTNYEEEELKGKIRITTRSKNSGIEEGHCVEMVAKVMPLPKAAIIDGYQFDRKMFFDGLSASGYTLSYVSEIDCDAPLSFKLKISAEIAKLRRKIIKRINEVLPPDTAGITAAIVAGERGGIDKEITNNYRDSGLAHFLSISGLHMSMLAGLMFFFIRLVIAFIPPVALRYDSKKISAWFAIFISIFYLMISGAQIPAQRAFIMTLIVLVGVLVSRTAISMKTIAWAALIVLILTPYAIVGASFQMSFAAVVALVAFYEKYAGNIHRFLKGDNVYYRGRISRFFRYLWVYIAGIVIADLVASLATLPFAIYHFNRIAIYTTLGNFLAGPIIGLLIMPFVLLALLLMPFGLDYVPLKIVGFGIGVVNDITAYVASLPSAGYQVLAMPLWGLLFIVLGGLWICIWQKSWRKWGWIAVVIGVLSMFVTTTPDVMINNDGSLVAIKDNGGELVILPARGNNMNKQIWLEKTANQKLTSIENKELREIYKGNKINKDWIDLKCLKDSCIYKNRFEYFKEGRLEIDGEKFDVETSLGASFYIEGNKVKTKTVREYIGNRIWNK